MNEQEMKDLIDDSSYEELLRNWRFAPTGSAFFQGEVGRYYEEVMAKKRAEVGDEQHAAISKKIGWKP